MISLQFNHSGAENFIPKDLFSENEKRIQQAFTELVTESGSGNDFLGWKDLPSKISPVAFEKIEHTAQKIAQQSEVVVVIGIGGSYLGARAVIEALQSHFRYLEESAKRPLILYAGNQMSEDYLFDLLNVLDRKDYSLIVISKSGTTTEPAIAFRVLKEHCEKKYGKTAAAQRIATITDQVRGALKQLSDEEGYKTFVIPDNVGGRYSVLTPVGLLPIAVAGFNIRDLVEGAHEMQQFLHSHPQTADNPAMQYAIIRNYLYNNKKNVELMVAYEPRLAFFIEWYKQLFGESEGKENQGIFPAGSIFSTDLHSLGQYIQEGERILFETVISIARTAHQVNIPYDEKNTDGLNYLQNKTIQEINHTAEIGTRMAHIDGGVPNLQIVLPEISEKTIGELIYFFEFTCALGGYLMRINPFNQPGVEAYKKNMFRLLGKK